MGMINHITGQIVPGVQEQIARRLARERVARTEFEQLVRARWARPFEFLETLLLLAREAGNTWARALVTLPEDQPGFHEWILLRLHGRTCRTGSEIFALLRSGYPDGALARWRTLHELVVTTRLLRKFGPPLAQRYVEHHVIHEYQMLCDYQKRAPALGYERTPREYMRALKEQYKHLERQYGADFPSISGSTMGWTLGIVPRRGGLSGLELLEAEVGLDHFRPFYRAGNDAIHANAAGIDRWLGDPMRRVFSLAATTNAGFGDPGQFCAIYITMATEALLLPSASVASTRPGWHISPPALGEWQTRWIKMMKEIMKSARDTFVETDRQIRAEYRRSQTT
jgi:hypothetical protein